MMAEKPMSVWQDAQPAPSFSALSGDLAVDVAIVGGGITGITAALLLKRAGKRVALIEAREIGGGVTARSTAHLTAIIDARYQDLASNFGEEGAKLVAGSSMAAIERIADFVRAEQIDCGFERVPGYLYTESSRERSMIEQEVETAKKLGLPASLADDAPLPFAVAAMKLDNQAQIDSLAYVRALVQLIPGDGCHVFTHTRVQDVQDGEPCRVQTTHGTITAHDVILATHTPINDLVAFQPKIAPYRSYVLGVKLNSPLPNGLFWDTMDPYHYTRASHDVRGDILIVGGEDHKTGQEGDPEAHYRQLEEYTRARFDVAEIVYRWSAQVYDPADGLPYIGLYPTNTHVYAATGYGGNGLTFATVAAMILTDTLLGRPNPWAELYDAGRVKPLAGGKRILAEGVNLATHAVGSWFKQDTDSLADVPAGEGRIVRVEGEQVAAYRDAGGALHTLSPTCPHAKCTVSWNNAEKSWDCPCHGGRFTATGELIEGPPVENLSPVSVQQ